jgi:hypothetical protein
LNDPAGLIENTAHFNIFTDDPAQLAAQKQWYADIMRRSKFVLCPRGVGTSSFRLFEAMKAGRCPVILSDGWVPPEAPAWESFSIRVPERLAERIPDLLRDRESEYLELGLRARQVFDEWFADNVKFDRMVESCASLLGENRMSETWRRRIPSVYRAWRAAYFQANRAKCGLRRAFSTSAVAR